MKIKKSVLKKILKDNLKKVSCIGIACGKCKLDNNPYCEILNLNDDCIDLLINGMMKQFEKDYKPKKKTIKKKKPCASCGTTLTNGNIYENDKGEKKSLCNLCVNFIIPNRYKLISKEDGRKGLNCKRCGHFIHKDNVKESGLCEFCELFHLLFPNDK